MSKIEIQLLRSMIASAANHLQNNRGKINDMNVFPVPDGDTGTNMSMTFGGAAKTALQSEEDSCDVLLNILAKAALRNARGNSGVILSQILRGIATACNGYAEIDTAVLREVFCKSRDTAYRAVMKPAEGTVLTVVRETAEFAEKNAGDYKEDPAGFLKAAAIAAKESLNRTPEMLPVLKQAGVVDAGGMGVVTLLEGAILALDGKPAELSDGEEISEASPIPETETDIKFRYCTEFLIQKESDRKTTQFRAAIQPEGDCILVIEEDEIVKVHIHTNRPGYVLEQAMKLGELTNLKIDNMKYQHNEKTRTAEGALPSERKKYGFVAVSAGDGLDEIFCSVGVDKIVSGGQTMNPSTQDLLSAVQAIHAETVFVFPNNKNIIMAANQVPYLADSKVLVIPTVNIPEGIAAMLAFDESLSPEQNFEAMQELAEHVHCGQLTFAARNSKIDGIKIKKDDIMGMCGSSIKVVGKDINEVALQLADELVFEGACVATIYYGADIKEETAMELSDAVSEKYPNLDVSVLYGGQPIYYYYLAVE